MQRCFAIVSPCVAMVVHRAWRNGWCTGRRFQDRSRRCMLRCEHPMAEDSIEHYAHCPCACDFACHTLHLPENAFGSSQSFLVLGVDAPDDILILQLLVLYACYSATNSVRHGRCSNEGNDYDRRDFLLQFAQGVMDHSRSRSALDRAPNAPFWNTGRSTRRRQT